MLEYQKYGNKVKVPKEIAIKELMKGWKMLKALEILKEKREICLRIYNGDDCSDGLDSYKDEIEAYNEAIEELEQYEQKFRDKEFKYRTDCQNILSAGRVEADNMPDKLAELEKVILDYYLAKGYGLGVGGWTFKVNISTLYKTKDIQIMFLMEKYLLNWQI